MDTPLLDFKLLEAIEKHTQRRVRQLLGLSQPL